MKIPQTEGTEELHPRGNSLIIVTSVHFGWILSLSLIIITTGL